MAILMPIDVPDVAAAQREFWVCWAYTSERRETLGAIVEGADGAWSVTWEDRAALLALRGRTTPAEGFADAHAIALAQLRDVFLGEVIAERRSGVAL